MSEYTDKQNTAINKAIEMMEKAGLNVKEESDQYHALIISRDEE